MKRALCGRTMTSPSELGVVSYDGQQSRHMHRAMRKTGKYKYNTGTVRSVLVITGVIISVLCLLLRGWPSDRDVQSVCKSEDLGFHLTYPRSPVRRQLVMFARF